MTTLGDVPDRAVDLLAVLGQSVQVRLLELSRSGCLLESRQPVEEGVTGELRLQVNGREYSDEIRVCRWSEVKGSGALYRIAAEFLWTRPPEEGSLRGAIRQILDGITPRSDYSAPG